MPLRARFTDDGKRATYRSVVRKGHPLSGADGKIRRCRLVLYEKIGPGEHPCEWCGTTLRWEKTQKAKPGALLADHLDGDPTNDAESNLVPSCNSCNCGRGMPSRISAGETVVKVGRHWRRGVEIHCAQCKRAFISPVTGKMVPVRKYCSPACFYKSPTSKTNAVAMQEARRIPSNVPTDESNGDRRRAVQFTCKQCMCVFYKRPTANARLFCSKNCYMAHKRIEAGFPGDVEVVLINGRRRGIERRRCAQCNSEFVFPIMSKNAGKFCSKPCESISRKKAA